MGYYCNNEDEHRSDARRDFNYRGAYGYDREYYDHYSSDGCKQAYTEEFDRQVQEERRQEERRQEERREEERQMEQMQMRQERERYERQQQEDDYYQQMQEQEYYNQMQQQEPKQQEPNDDLPFWALEKI